MTAYSSLGQGGSPPFLGDGEVEVLAGKYDDGLGGGAKATAAQVVLSWAVQRRTVIIPKTENLERMKRNISVRFLSSWSFLRTRPNLID